MALSDEWEEVHLTENGWVDGSNKLDHRGVESVPVPVGAVLTAYRRVSVGAIGATPQITMRETSLVNNTDQIARLRSKYGPPVFCV